ncbi:MAG: DUF1294 domain-containing protein [Bacteroidales bacterium]|nr:DUF1294 domain-containing protein [Bacteroidales bacterium]
MKYLAAILVTINFITFLLYAIDKRKAQKHLWRIPESVLLWFSFLGGSVGALFGMYLLRHKTKHLKFKLLVPLFLLLHIGLIVYFCW